MYIGSFPHFSPSSFSGQPFFKEIFNQLSAKELYFQYLTYYNKWMVLYNCTRLRAGELKKTNRELFFGQLEIKYNYWAPLYTKPTVLLQKNSQGKTLG